MPYARLYAPLWYRARALTGPPCERAAWLSGATLVLPPRQIAAPLAIARSCAHAGGVRSRGLVMARDPLLRRLPPLWGAEQSAQPDSTVPRRGRAPLARREQRLPVIAIDVPVDP
jgi:hypothetical protein